MRTIFIFILLVFMASCFTAPDFDIGYYEVARITAPSGRIDAVLAESNGGATTSFGYYVFIVPTGGIVREGIQVASLYGATRNESAYGANLKWNGTQKLIVEYFKAKDEPSSKSSINIASEQVQILLHSGIKDESAPSGGMFYNLEKRKGN